LDKSEGDLQNAGFRADKHIRHIQHPIAIGLVSNVGTIFLAQICIHFGMTLRGD